MKNVKENILKVLTIVPISFWMLFFVAIPLLYIVFISFMQRGDDGSIVYISTISNYTRMARPLYVKVFLDSIVVAFVTTLFTLVFGYPFAYFATKIKKYKILVMLLIMAPFLTNSLIRTYGWIVILSTNGILNHALLITGIIKEPLKMLYSYGAVMIGMIYTMFPFMVLPLYNSIDKMDRAYIEAAKDLGSSRWRTFRTVTVPLTMPGIVAGCILVFVPSVGLFFIPDLMGGSNVMLIGNLIENQFMGANDWPFGAALSIIMIFISLILILVYVKIVGKKLDTEVF
ncbi:ABC transporter permease [Clostridium estertheticum]|uniref:Spermidine/putrescine ABC transporter permease n=2 Tax=Clostridium estertheticum TaxID=238834 RepID=A0A1J0GEF1_9CLOT|nr:ABC transporter permease [Clostridium estertheticum]APC39384.1 spermidine/putrescine ABC transporter permease [Clostridium estertheticum subsp. estertheticum]MBU3072060.1 ABC transporter permease [Clostridium estertheticum]MBU3162152.1 ABC transporter permease [Clostridium estertheticum]MBU3170580.1 ABC transporter permease [Clostridium estertheticum]MBU3184785.1 ABC transporter permease [Clostridium estertheticum]